MSDNKNYIPGWVQDFVIEDRKKDKKAKLEADLKVAEKAEKVKPVVETKIDEKK